MINIVHCVAHRTVIDKASLKIFSDFHTIAIAANIQNLMGVNPFWLFGILHTPLNFTCHHN
jgi:hypothetical protein